MKIQDRQYRVCCECGARWAIITFGQMPNCQKCKNTKIQKHENTKIQKIQKMKIQDIECVVNVVRGGPLSPLVRCRTAKKCKNTKIQKHKNTKIKKNKK